MATILRPDSSVCCPRLSDPDAETRTRTTDFLARSGRTADAPVGMVDRGEWEQEITICPPDCVLTSPLSAERVGESVVVPAKVSCARGRAADAEIPEAGARAPTNFLHP